MLLTEADLVQLTGYVQAARQSKWLDEQGIRYFTRRDGRISVTWEQVNHVDPAPRRKPKLEAARG